MNVESLKGKTRYLHMPRKRWLALGMAITAIAGFLLLYRPSRLEETATRILTIENGSIEDVVTAQGKLEPKEYVDVGTQVSGQLKVLHIEIGDDVKEGDLLAEIDPRLYQAKVDADTAQLKSLQAGLSEQQANLNLAKQLQSRYDLLIQSNAISKQEYDQSAASLKAAQAKVNTQSAQIEQIQSTLKGDLANLSYTKIFAPMSGTVATLPARLGQTLNANQTAPILMQLANLDTMTIRAQVAEADIMRLQPEMPVRFTTLGNMERQWRGTIRQILPSPEIINDVVLYNVLIDVDNKDRALMNGMSTQLFFEIGAVHDVPVIPLEALGRRIPDRDGEHAKAYAVRVKRGGKTEERMIQTGMSDRLQAEVKSGLAVGEQVAVAMRKPAGRGNSGNRGGIAPGAGGPRL